MLIPDVLAEVLRFFDRRYLTKLQLHGRGLRDIVDAACPKYPLASLRRVTVRVVPPASAVIEMVNADYKRIDSDPLDFFDTVRDVKILLQKSYVHRFELCAHDRQEKAPITNDQWSALLSAIQFATAEHLMLKELDLTGVQAEQIKEILSASCLDDVWLWWCRLLPGSISDAFLLRCADKGITRLAIDDPELVDGSSMMVTEEAIFDYCFRAERQHGTTVINRLSIVDVSNSFLRRLIKRMEDLHSAQPYDLGFIGLNAQDGLDDAGQYLVDTSLTRTITFKIPFSYNSQQSSHFLWYQHDNQ